MRQSKQSNLNWQFIQTGQILRSPISCFITSVCCLFPIQVFAQSNIVPDRTLGDTNSIVIPNFDGLPQELITGGAVRGQNLFHSFQEFNILEGREAYFANPEGISSIFSRVTGSNISEIFGTLGVNGTANLYFMNPNGIIFGPNASLDVGGSFVGTTADEIQFGEQGFFSATEPNAPPLLTVNPSAFFFNQINPGDIVNNSTAAAGTDPSGSFTAFGLRVPDGKSLSLLGENITVDGGEVLAFGGTVNFVSVADTGKVNLDIAGDNFRFSFTDLARGNIAIANSSRVLALGNGGGEINLTSRDIAISNNSLVETGIASDLGSATTQAGDITLDATEDISIDNSSFVLNRVRTTSNGNSGDIVANANTLTINNGGQLGLLVFGRGNTGNLEINVAESVVIDTKESGLFTGIFAQVRESGFGNVGNVSIEANTLNLSNGGRIDTISSGQGNSGQISIQANSLNLDNFSFISTETTGNTEGDAGNIFFEVNSLTLTNNSNLNSSSFGQGNSGLIEIVANNTISFNSSSIFSEFALGALGEGNNIKLNSNEIILDNGSFISSRNFGQGNSGNIQIETNTLTANNGSQVNTSNFGQGNAGFVVIDANESITFTGVGNGFFSAIFTETGQGVTGSAGAISLSSNSLILSDGARLSSSSFGTGNAGNIDINITEKIDISGANTLVLANVGATAMGDVEGGEISLITQQLSVTSGAQISSSTFGMGNAGNISITASDRVSLVGGSDNFRSIILSNIESGAIGNGGEIQIFTNTFEITDGAQLQTLVRGATDNFFGGQGDAGSIEVNADSNIIIDGFGGGFSSAIVSEVGAGARGNAGDIKLTSENLTITNAAILSADTFGEGNVGNIKLNIAELTEISGENTRVRANVRSNASNIQGGNLTIDTKQLLVIDGAQVSVSTFGQGDAGDLVINATESVELRGEDNIATGFFPGGLFAQVDVDGEGQGGDLILNTSRLSISNGSKVQVATFGNGDAGELIITADEIDIFNTAQFSDFTTGIFGSVETDRFRTVDSPEGNGGDITIRTNRLRVIDGGKLSVTTSGIGNAGTLDIVAKESIEIRGVDPEPEDGVSFIGGSVEEEAIGDGGDVNIVTQNLAISDRGEISVSSLGTGVGGDINITASSLNLDESAIINAETLTDDGGNINLRVADLITLDNQSRISATAGTAEAGGNGGNVTIDTEFLVAFPSSNSDITANAFAGDGGRIDLAAESIFGIQAGLATPNNSTNDIDASSQFGLDGDVSIDTPDVDPARGLDNLPSDLGDASRLITRNCLATADAEEQLNQFVITGKGGFPTNPENLISGDATLSAEWLTLPETEQAFVHSTKLTNQSLIATPEIVEATNWAFNQQGELVLVSSKSQTEFKIPWLPENSCSASS